MSTHHHASADDPAQSPNESRPAVSNEQNSIFPLLFDNSPLLLGVAELDGDTIIGVNGDPTIAQILGLSLDDKSNRTGEESGNSPEENQIWLEHYRRSQQERKPVKFEYERLYRNCSQWLSATVNYLGTNSQNRPRFSFIAEDITERKQLDQALKASEQKYRELIQYAPLGFYEIDFRTGRLISINDSAAELTGYSREELLQMTPFDLLDQEGQVIFGKRIRQWLSGEMPEESVEYRIKAKDGHTIYTVLNVSFTKDEHGQPLGATVIGYDITERKQAEEALARSNQKISEILSSITDDFYVLDRDWKFVYTNRQFTERIGKEPEDFVGKSIWELFPKHVGSTLYENFHASMEKGEKRRFEIGGQYTDAWYSMTCFPSSEGITVLGTDISERIRAEEEEREHRLQMEIQRRLLEYREQERQAIARDLHDGPVQDINSLLFNIQFVKEVVTDSSIKLELEKIAAGLRTSVQNLREMINAMRPPSLIRFGLAKAFNAYLEDFQERHPEIEFNNSMMEDGNRLSEPVRLGLYRILQEALTNIIKHANASQVDVTLLFEEHQAILEVHDDGVGFSLSENLLDYSSRGHFGLVGMKERADAASGQIQVTSIPGKGTKVKVVIPID